MAQKIIPETFYFYVQQKNSETNPYSLLPMLKIFPSNLNQIRYFSDFSSAKSQDFF